MSPMVRKTGSDVSLDVPSSHHDVVIVGARCAGAATALLLARAGHDVALVDRAATIGETNSTHSLVRGGVVQLSRWGLLGRVLSTGAPPIRSVSFFRHDRDGSTPTRRTVKDRAGVDLMLAPRRSVLDRILVDEAVRAGATLHTGTTAGGVLRDTRGRVVGVAVHDARGEPRRLTGRLVVGADGVRSQMAHHLGAVTTEAHGPSGACFYTYVGGVPWDGFEFHLGRDAFAGVFPTNDDRACVWLMRPADAAASVVDAGSGRLEAWLRTLDAAVPDLAGRVRAGSVDAPLRGSIRLPNHVRQAAGPGWALVGDAGYHRDPITGHGMTDAFRDAELLAVAADRALRDPEEERAALADYERERDDAIAETFRLTRRLGSFPAPDRFEALQTEFARALDAEALELAARRPIGALPVPVP